MKDTAIGQLLLVLTTCSVVLHAVVVSTFANETDRLSLLEFKKAIILDPQRALTSWSESNHFCDWGGVSRRSTKEHPRRVVALHLVNRGLVGQISLSLGNLTFLRHLALLRIPPSIARLRRLRTLFLSNNALEGSIPNLANCSGLKVLWLNNNDLVGRIHADFPPQLEELQLSSNGIGGTIPPSLANITSMKKFSCAYNRIEGSIPDELGKLDGLEILYVGRNQLVGRFPQAVG